MIGTLSCATCTPLIRISNQLSAHTSAENVSALVAVAAAISASVGKIRVMVRP
ncbi:MAG: hypothetical protein QNK87_12905 [Octadecabacter sp.]